MCIMKLLFFWFQTVKFIIINTIKTFHLCCIRLSFALQASRNIGVHTFCDGVHIPAVQILQAQTEPQLFRYFCPGPVIFGGVLFVSVCVKSVAVLFLCEHCYCVFLCA